VQTRPQKPNKTESDNNREPLPNEPAISTNTNTISAAEPEKKPTFVPFSGQGYSLKDRGKGKEKN